MAAVAALRPNTFTKLLLIDPTIRPPEIYGTEPIDASFIRKRRSTWVSADEMFQRFRDRTPFQSWQIQVLRDYCDFGLVSNNGGFALACPPEVEASIYECSTEPEANLHRALPSIAQPVIVLRATSRLPGLFHGNTSPTDPGLATRLPCGRDVPLPEYSHFIPMESPQLVADHIRMLIEGAG